MPDTPAASAATDLPVEWTDWRESPAVQHSNDKKALKRVLDELEDFLRGAPQDEDVASLQRDINRCRHFLLQSAPTVLSKGVRA